MKKGEKVEKVMESEERESGVNIKEVMEKLKKEIDVWVDKGEVR
jgi:predicted fused transcriptional regulator/phosphomethylpyrimidine kinase